MGLRRGAIDDSNEISCDLTDRESVRNAIERLGVGSYSHLIHTAAITPWSNASDFSLDQTMAESVMLLCEQLKIPNLFFISGWNVYDSSASVPYQETTFVNPNTDYGISKYKVENMLHNLNRGDISVLNLRLASAYGPGQLSAGLIPNIVTSALNEGRITIKNPHVKRDYIYIDDVVRAIDMLTQRNDLAGSINIGSGMSVEVGEVAKVIRTVCKEKYGKDVDISIQDDDGMTGLRDNRLDIKKAQSLGLLQHLTSLATGVESYVTWRMERI